MNEEEYETQISAEYIYMLDKQQEEIEQLQNNWNELKKWLEEEYEYYDKYGTSVHGYAMGQINRIKSKMQELEGNNE